MPISVVCLQLTAIAGLTAKDRRNGLFVWQGQVRKFKAKRAIKDLDSNTPHKFVVRMKNLPRLAQLDSSAHLL